MLLIIIISIVLVTSCNKSSNPTDSIVDGVSTNGAFTLFSSEIGPDSLLPIDYTCDGESATLPLEWSGYPEETNSFALIMHHEASPTDIHWYWILYNIPATINSLHKNVSGTGTLGTNSVNNQIGYSPPCSQGPGPKAYIFTLYALSEELEITVPATDVDLDFIINKMAGKVISTASMTVYYEREIE